MKHGNAPPKQNLFGGVLCSKRKLKDFDQINRRKLTSEFCRVNKKKRKQIRNNNKSRKKKQKRIVTFPNSEVPMLAEKWRESK